MLSEYEALVLTNLKASGKDPRLSWPAPPVIRNGAILVALSLLSAGSLMYAGGSGDARANQPASGTRVGPWPRAHVAGSGGAVLKPTANGNKQGKLFLGHVESLTVVEARARAWRYQTPSRSG
jgi:hypothetical protein